ncbi:hypothetical protein PoB_006819400 [Plakobranchus ocellatus]|uniref:Uncharacterized protein n=1 Tax=Plakobranchus ocellatus TaxID=259542 RepID=A0AAV4DBW1_9GAST|nr:hypothetical protein PoB_006819400 [Plakobranchus ocellatus]
MTPLTVVVSDFSLQQKASCRSRVPWLYNVPTTSLIVVVSNSSLGQKGCYRSQVGLALSCATNAQDSGGLQSTTEEFFADYRAGHLQENLQDLLVFTKIGTKLAAKQKRKGSYRAAQCAKMRAKKDELATAGKAAATYDSPQPESQANCSRKGCCNLRLPSSIEPSCCSRKGCNNCRLPSSIEPS